MPLRNHLLQLTDQGIRLKGKMTYDHRVQRPQGHKSANRKQLNFEESSVWWVNTPVTREGVGTLMTVDMQRGDSSLLLSSGEWKKGNDLLKKKKKIKGRLGGEVS